MRLIALEIAIVSLLTAITAKAAEMEIRATSVNEMAPPSGSDENSLLLEVDLPEQLLGARIDRAVLMLPVAEDSTRKDQPLLIAPIGGTWNASQSVLPFTDLSPIDSLSVVQFVIGSPESETAIDITPVVSAWVNGVTPNHGLIVSGLPGLEKPIRLSRDRSNLWTDPPVMRVWFTPSYRQ